MQDLRSVGDLGAEESIMSFSRPWSGDGVLSGEVVCKAMRSRTTLRRYVRNDSPDDFTRFNRLTTAVRLVKAGCTPDEAVRLMRASGI